MWILRCSQGGIFLNRNAQNYIKLTSSSDAGILWMLHLLALKQLQLLVAHFLLLLTVRPNG